MTRHEFTHKKNTEVDYMVTAEFRVREKAFFAIVSD